MQRVVLEHTVMVRCTCKIHEIIGFFQLQYSTFTVICHSVFSRDNGPCLFLGAHYLATGSSLYLPQDPQQLHVPPHPPSLGSNRSVGLRFLYQKLMASVMISANWPGYIKCAYTIPIKDNIIPPLLPAHNNVILLQPKSARKIPQPLLLPTSPDTA